MQFDRAGKIIFRVKLTSAEQKALDEEVDRQARAYYAEFARKHEIEVEAIVMRQLKRLTGWGETRLKRFYDDFTPELDKLVEYYEMGDDDAAWLCTRELLAEGIDIEKWHKEKYPND